MGRIKTALVKRTTFELLKDEEIDFSPDFEKNKKLLKNLMPSKKIRNKIAGYLARLVKAKQKEKQ